MEMIITPLQEELILAAGGLAAKKEFDHLLYIGDLPLPEHIVKARSMARKKLVQAVSSKVQCQVITAMGIPTISMPAFNLARSERFKVALVGGLAQGLFKQGDVVLGMAGRTPTSYPDSLLVVTIGVKDENSVDTGFSLVGTENIPPSILESLIDLALSIAVDGWEGRPIGSLMVIGETAAVMEKSRQITLNPFQGYSETEKNILNPQVRNAIRNFAVLDGAFVIREDGVVLAAGRYMKFDDSKEFNVPLGLGARHVAAAGISQDTNAIAIVVSETLGEVRIFQQGQCVMQLNPQIRHKRWLAPDNDSFSYNMRGFPSGIVDGKKEKDLDQTQQIEADAKEHKESKDGKDRSKDGKDRSKDGKDRSKDGKDRSKDGKDRSKDGKDSKDSKDKK